MKTSSTPNIDNINWLMVVSPVFGRCLFPLLVGVFPLISELSATFLFSFVKKIAASCSFSILKVTGVASNSYPVGAWVSTS